MKEKPLPHNGYHVLLDFYQCRNEKVLRAIDMAQIRAAIEASGMRVADELNFRFGEADDAGSYSFCFVLFESHCSGHSWPDEGMVNLDVYVCHHSADNTSKAEEVVRFLEDLYQPEHAVIQRINRGDSSMFNKK